MFGRHYARLKVDAGRKPSPISNRLSVRMRSLSGTGSKIDSWIVAHCLTQPGHELGPSGHEVEIETSLHSHASGVDTSDWFAELPRLRFVEGCGVGDPPRVEPNTAPHSSSNPRPTVTTADILGTCVRSTQREYGAVRACHRKECSSCRRVYL